MTCFFIIVSFLVFLCLFSLFCSYFKPTPRWDKETCTLHLPKSSPLQTFSSKDNAKYPKQSACLEACKQLHKCGALTDNLVPDMVAEEAVAQGIGIHFLSICNFNCLFTSWTCGCRYNSPIPTLVLSQIFQGIDYLMMNNQFMFHQNLCIVVPIIPV